MNPYPYPADRTVNLTLNNLSVTGGERGGEGKLCRIGKPSSVTASILTEKWMPITPLRAGSRGREVEFTNYEITENGVKFSVPASSVVLLRIR